MIDQKIDQAINQTIEQLNNWTNVDDGGNKNGGGDGNDVGGDFFGSIIKWYRILREWSGSLNHATIVSGLICVHSLSGRQFIGPAKLVFWGVKYSHQISFLSFPPN